MRIEGLDVQVATVRCDPSGREVLTSLHADDDEHLACLATIHGPVTVTADYW